MLCEATITRASQYWCSAVISCHTWWHEHINVRNIITCICQHEHPFETFPRDCLHLSTPSYEWTIGFCRSRFARRRWCNAGASTVAPELVSQFVVSLWPSFYFETCLTRRKKSVRYTPCKMSSLKMLQPVIGFLCHLRLRSAWCPESSGRALTIFGPNLCMKSVWTSQNRSRQEQTTPS